MIPNQSTPVISRRGLIRALARPFENLRDLPSSGPPQSEDEGAPCRAVIQGRFCLAYQGSPCFTCSERCPEQGAITMNKGIPTIHEDKCTGCRICFDLCPAPRNAILLLPKKESANQTTKH